MAAAIITPLIPLLEAEAPVLIADIIALFKKHPALTPDALTLIATAIHNTNSATQATIAADQTSHPQS